MDTIDKVTKKIKKGKAIETFKSRSDEILDELNSIALNLSSAIDEAREDEDFDEEEKREFGKAIEYIISRVKNTYSKIIQVNRKL